MTLVNLPEVPNNPTTEQLAQIVGAIVQELMYTLNGFVSSDNSREFGGWQIGKTEMQSKDKTVGMSTNKNGVDPIRFFAGDVIDGTPKFKVTESGVLTAIGALFLSALGYPRVEINSINNLIAAYADADTYISFLPNYSGSIPTLVLVDAGTTKAFLNRPNTASGTTLGTFDGESLNLQSSGPLKVDGNSGFSGTVYVAATSGGPATIPITFYKGVRTS